MALHGSRLLIFGGFTESSSGKSTTCELLLLLLFMQSGLPVCLQTVQASHSSQGKACRCV